MPSVRRFDDPREFARFAEPFLMRDEARHNLELGICRQLTGPEASRFGPEAPYLAVAESDDGVVGVAIRTPPFHVLITVADPASHGAFADDLRRRFASLSGVTSDSVTAAAFAAAWHERTGDAVREGMPQRIYRLATPPDVPDVPGGFRAATSADRDLLTRWIGEFNREAMPDAPHEDPAAIVDRRLADGSFFLWQQGEPVSFAGFGASTPNGIRVGPVYTPRGHRGHGYASACVATLSRRLLDQGNRFLFLYTDLGNPASNHVYLKMGYEPVCDMQELRFEPTS